MFIDLDDNVKSADYWNKQFITYINPITEIKNWPQTSPNSTWYSNKTSVNFQILSLLRLSDIVVFCTSDNLIIS